MPKINSLPQGTMTLAQVKECLGISRQVLHRSGLTEFLLYHEVGRSRLYLSEDVGKIKYWIFVQRGLATLGFITPSPPAPLLPPGENYEQRRASFDAWFQEDSNGTYCPQCDRDAVQDDLGEGPVWCIECGIVTPPEQDRTNAPFARVVVK